MMQNVEFALEDRPGALADLGEAMGDAGLAFEGGGVFTHNGKAIAHFLFKDGNAAKVSAEAAGIKVVGVWPVLIRRLKQGAPGQLGAISRALANNEINIITQYSDHNNQLILVVDDRAEAKTATASWNNE